jgi:hypothetical protein
MSQIVIHDPVKLREAIDFADRAGCIDQLGRDLLKLLRTLTVGMTKENDRTASLSDDFAPMSMRFVIWDGPRLTSEALVFNGGWIYAGPGAPGDGSGPSFSVDLSYVMGARPEHSWNVHT